MMKKVAWPMDQCESRTCSRPATTEHLGWKFCTYHRNRVSPGLHSKQEAKDFAQLGRLAASYFILEPVADRIYHAR